MPGLNLNDWSVPRSIWNEHVESNCARYLDLRLEVQWQQEAFDSGRLVAKCPGCSFLVLCNEQQDRGKHAKCTNIDVIENSRVFPIKRVTIERHNGTTTGISADWILTHPIATGFTFQRARRCIPSNACGRAVAWIVSAHIVSRWYVY